MDFVVRKGIESAVGGAISQATAVTGDNSKKIDWNDYNFPPCLHLVHFSLSELQGTVKRFVMNVYISFVIVVCVLLINSMR